MRTASVLAWWAAGTAILLAGAQRLARRHGGVDPMAWVALCSFQALALFDAHLNGDFAFAIFPLPFLVHMASDRRAEAACSWNEALRLLLCDTTAGDFERLMVCRRADGSSMWVSFCALSLASNYLVFVITRQIAAMAIAPLGVVGCSAILGWAAWLLSWARVWAQLMVTRNRLTALVQHLADADCHLASACVRVVTTLVLLVGVKPWLLASECGSFVLPLLREPVLLLRLVRKTVPPFACAMLHLGRAGFRLAACVPMLLVGLLWLALRWLYGCVILACTCVARRACEYWRLKTVLQVEEGYSSIGALLLVTFCASASLVVEAARSQTTQLAWQTLLLMARPLVRAVELDANWLGGWACVAWLFGQRVLALLFLGCALCSATAQRLVPALIEMHEQGLLRERVHALLARSPHPFLLARGRRLLTSLSAAHPAPGHSSSCAERAERSSAAHALGASEGRSEHGRAGGGGSGACGGGGGGGRRRKAAKCGAAGSEEARGGTTASAAQAEFAQRVAHADRQPQRQQPQSQPQKQMLQAGQLRHAQSRHAQPAAGAALCRRSSCSDSSATSSQSPAATPAPRTTTTTILDSAARPLPLQGPTAAKPSPSAKAAKPLTPTAAPPAPRQAQAGGAQATAQCGVGGGDNDGSGRIATPVAAVAPTPTPTAALTRPPPSQLSPSEQQLLPPPQRLTRQPAAPAHGTTVPAAPRAAAAGSSSALDSSSSSERSLADELVQLSNMFEARLLTAAEFSAAKAAILHIPTKPAAIEQPTSGHQNARWPNKPSAAAAHATASAEQLHAPPSGRRKDEPGSQVDSSCVICLERRRTHAFVPLDLGAQCLHKCVCETCAANIKSLGREHWLCPMCRTVASDIKFVFD
jgi:hypothetical protein